MIIGNALTFGGGGIDLTVTGGTARPQSPKENTIWVNSGISLGETVISPIAPTAPVVGDVWIVAANKAYGGEAGAGHIVRVSSDPALEINVMNIQQWDGTAWVNCVDSGIYVGGAWQDMALYLFANGVLNAGYSDVNVYSVSGSLTNKIDSSKHLTFPDGKIKLANSSDNKIISLAFIAPIDFNRYSTLTVGFGAVANKNRLFVYITGDNPGGGINISTAIYENTLSISANSQKTYDISEVSAAEGYLWLRPNNSSGEVNSGYAEFTYIALTP